MPDYYDWEAIVLVILHVAAWAVGIYVAFHFIVKYW